MTYSYHANQYEGAFNSSRMSNWTIPKTRDQTAKKPKFREGSSFFIADDKGYLKPGVPRSKANHGRTVVLEAAGSHSVVTVPKRNDRRTGGNGVTEGDSNGMKGVTGSSQNRSIGKENPWGTFVGTWQMPHRIPQPRPNLTARSSAAAARLINQVKASPLYKASNGFGLQAAFPHCMEQAQEETFEEHCAQIQDTPALPPQLSDQEEGAGDLEPTGTPPPAQVRPSPPGTRGSGRVMTPGTTGRVSTGPEDPRGSPDSALQCRSPLIG